MVRNMTCGSFDKKEDGEIIHIDFVDIYLKYLLHNVSYMKSYVANVVEEVPVTKSTVSSAMQADIDLHSNSYSKTFILWGEVGINTVVEKY